MFSAWRETELWMWLHSLKFLSGAINFISDTRMLEPKEMFKQSQRFYWVCSDITKAEHVQKNEASKCAALYFTWQWISRICAQIKNAILNYALELDCVPKQNKTLMSGWSTVIEDLESPTRNYTSSIIAQFLYAILAVNLGIECGLMRNPSAQRNSCKQLQHANKHV